MIKIEEDNMYTFFYNGKKYIVEKTESDIEVYEEEDPSKTGFVFDNIKAATFFANSFIDIVEDIIDKGKKEKKWN